MDEKNTLPTEPAEKPVEGHEVEELCDDDLEDVAGGWDGEEPPPDGTSGG